MISRDRSRSTRRDFGARALVVGRFSSGDLRISEFRDGHYSTAGLTDVSIIGFDQSPWLGRSGVQMSDVAWRPGKDCGYMVGGCSTLTCNAGYLIYFSVQNGHRLCF